MPEKAETVECSCGRRMVATAILSRGGGWFICYECPVCGERLPMEWPEVLTQNPTVEQLRDQGLRIVIR
jgi:hypothetical protein